jgi:hypothetical protein
MTSLPGIVDLKDGTSSYSVRVVSSTRMAVGREPVRSTSGSSSRDKIERLPQGCSAFKVSRQFSTSARSGVSRAASRGAARGGWPAASWMRTRLPRLGRAGGSVDCDSPHRALRAACWLLDSHNIRRNQKHPRTPDIQALVGNEAGFRNHQPGAVARRHQDQIRFA